MKTETKDCMTAREWIYKLVEVIDDAYLEDVKWLIQGFAAKSLNKMTEETKQDNE